MVVIWTRETPTLRRVGPLLSRYYFLCFSSFIRHCYCPGKSVLSKLICLGLSANFLSWVRGTAGTNEMFNCSASSFCPELGSSVVSPPTWVKQLRGTQQFSVLRPPQLRTYTRCGNLPLPSCGWGDGGSYSLEETPELCKIRVWKFVFARLQDFVLEFQIVSYAGLFSVSGEDNRHGFSYLPMSVLFTKWATSAVTNCTKSASSALR